MLTATQIGLTYGFVRGTLHVRLFQSYIGSRWGDPTSMFKLSKKADYGLIAVKHLAMHRKEHHACSANEIAEEYGISATLMAKVLQNLAREGRGSGQAWVERRLSVGEGAGTDQRARCDFGHRWAGADHVVRHESRELRRHG